MTLQGACEEGVVFQPGQEPELGPGVRGVLFDQEDRIVIAVLYATEPGSGDVGRYLDALPKDRLIIFSCVISPRLRGMLERRGYVPGVEHHPRVGDYPVMRREPEWTDEFLLGYVELHSESELALFSLAHVNRLLRLAGDSRYPLKKPAFLRVDRWTAKPLVEAARERLKDQSCPTP